MVRPTQWANSAWRLSLSRPQRTSQRPAVSFGSWADQAPWRASMAARVRHAAEALDLRAEQHALGVHLEAAVEPCGTLPEQEICAAAMGAALSMLEEFLQAQCRDPGRHDPD